MKRATGRARFLSRRHLVLRAQNGAPAKGIVTRKGRDSHRRFAAIKNREARGAPASRARPRNRADSPPANGKKSALSMKNRPNLKGNRDCSFEKLNKERRKPRETSWTSFFLAQRDGRRRRAALADCFAPGQSHRCRIAQAASSAAPKADCVGGH